MTEPEEFTYARSSNDPLDYDPPLRYETVAYGGDRDNNLTCFLPSSPTKLTDTRLPAPIVPSSMLLPGGAWHNGATYPTMFEKVRLTGTAWTCIGTTVAYDTYMFTAAQTGYYKLKVHNGALMYVSSKNSGESRGTLTTPITMGTFLMKARRDEMLVLDRDDIGPLGSPQCKQVLFASCPPFRGGEVFSGQPATGSRYSQIIPPVEIIVSLGEGESIVPFVGFFNLDSSSGIDVSRMWSDVMNADFVNALYVYDYSGIPCTDPDTGETYQLVSRETSFGYERID